MASWVTSSNKRILQVNKNTANLVNYSSLFLILFSKFSRNYALQVFNNGLRHYDCLENPHNISAIPASTKGNVLKAMVNLSKFLGCYQEYKAKLRNSGVKWLNTDDSFNSFLRIVNNNHNSLHLWYKPVNRLLRENERLFLKYTLVSGLRKGEAVSSFNLIVELSQQNRLSEHYNSNIEILEHYKYADLFLRQTKKVYISIVPKDLVSAIERFSKVSYSAIRKRLIRHK